jgi:hypothetical protein
LLGRCLNEVIYVVELLFCHSVLYSSRDRQGDPNIAQWPETILPTPGTAVSLKRLKSKKDLKLALEPGEISCRRAL